VPRDFTRPWRAGENGPRSSSRIKWQRPTFKTASLQAPPVVERFPLWTGLRLSLGGQGKAVACDQMSIQPV
jgi:hypothetical protein